jgi:hypothetical protein
MIATVATGFQIDTVQSEKDLFEVYTTLCWVPVMCSGHVFVLQWECILSSFMMTEPISENLSTCLVFRNFANTAILFHFKTTNLISGARIAQSV